jgi:hypothetical protein
MPPSPPTGDDLMACHHMARIDIESASQIPVGLSRLSTIQITNLSSFTLRQRRNWIGPFRNKTRF